MRPTLVAHCDWSAGPRGRRVCVARRDGGGDGVGGWRVSAPAPVGDPGALLRGLTAEGPALVGVDFPIGVPAAYAARVGIADAREAIARLGRPDWRALVAERPEDVSPSRPFYPMRPGGARRDHLSAGLGLAFHDLLRRCDHGCGARPDACVMFWTMGGQQVGKGMLSGWAELVRPALERGAALWPFDGDLPDLLAGRSLTLAETYPADCLRQLRAHPGRGFGKRKAADRAAVFRDRLEPVAAGLGATLSPEARSEGLAGFPESRDDGFDALVGALAMIRTVDRGEETAPADPVVRRIEGWMLGYAEPGGSR